LLQIISGTLNSTAGTVNVKGRVAALLELGAGFNPEFTGRENVHMAASIYGLSDFEIKERFSSIVEFSGIADFIDQPVKTYSSGMYLRLAFSVIAHVDASILIIDEALSVGDVRFQQKCLRFLSDFKKKGGTLLFVSHDTSLVMSLCERALYLSRNELGYFSQEGLVDEIVREYIKDSYLGQQEIHNSVQNKTITETNYKSNLSDKIKNECGDEIVASNSTVELSNYTKVVNSYGDGGAQILDVEIRDLKNSKLTSLKTGDNIILAVKFLANRIINKPAVTIIIKDRAGQFVIADGTVDACSEAGLIMYEGDISEVILNFQFPILVEGLYMIDIALADGTHFDHKLMQWQHDAIDFRVNRGRNTVGICGLQNLSINWNLQRTSKRE
jgi:lipopolysaccharide transport system ATP-binding protein